MPAASIDRYTQDPPYGMNPALWGLIAKRIRQPGTSTAVSGPWTFESESYDSAGHGLAELLENGYLADWRALLDSNTVLEAIATQRFGVWGGLITYTPSRWPARYVALNIDSADIDQLIEMLDELEAGGEDGDWLTWWRARFSSAISFRFPSRLTTFWA